MTYKLLEFRLPSIEALGAFMPTIGGKLILIYFWTLD